MTRALIALQFVIIFTLPSCKVAILCPFSKVPTLVGWAKGTQPDILCYSIHERNSLSLKDSEDFCSRTYGDSHVNRLESEDLVEKKLLSSKRLLLKVEGDVCTVMHKGTVKKISQECDDEDKWNILVCVHRPFDICEVSGTCVHDQNTDSCTFSFVSFKWKHFKETKFHCQSDYCWCSPCKKSKWSDWFEDANGKVVRRRPFDNKPQANCRLKPSDCCTELLKRCENEGVLNENTLRCVCKDGFLGLRCERENYDHAKMYILYGAVAVFIVVALGLLKVVLTRNKRKKTKVVKVLEDPASVLSDRSNQESVGSMAKPRKGNYKRADPNEKSMKDYEVPKLK